MMLQEIIVYIVIAVVAIIIIKHIWKRTKGNNNRGCEGCQYNCGCSKCKQKCNIPENK